VRRGPGYLPPDRAAFPPEILADGPAVALADGIAWRLHFGEEPAPDFSGVNMRVRGRFIQPDKDDVELCTMLASK
jgi:hypothetical protein